MSVSNELGRVTATAADGQTVFPFTNILIFSSTDLLVFRNGVQLSFSTHYTVSLTGAAPSDGNVTLVGGADSGDIIVIERNIPRFQPTVYNPGTSFPAKSHENALDRLTLEVTDTHTRANYAPEFPRGYIGNYDWAYTNLPDASTPKVPIYDPATKSISWSDTGQPTSSLDFGALTGTLDISGDDARVENFALAATGAVERNLRERFTDVINVKDFGAKGDNVSNDTDAFTAAFAAVPTQGGIIRIPAGIYILLDGFAVTNKAVAIVGDGVGVTILRWIVGTVGEGLTISQDSSDQTLRIEGLTFLTDRAALGNAISIDHTGQVSGGIVTGRSIFKVILKNLDIRGTFGAENTGFANGILMDEVMNAKITDVWFIGHHDVGGFRDILSGSGIAMTGVGQPAGMLITDCVFFLCQVAISIIGYEGVLMDRLNCVIVDEGVVAQPTGIHIDLEHSHIQSWLGCVRYDGISQSFINDCLFYGSALVTQTIAAVQLSGCVGVQVGGNYIHRTDAGGLLDGILLSNSSNNCVINPNFLSIGLDNGLHLGATANHNRVEHQNGFPVSMATMLLDEGTLNIRHGSTTIVTPSAALTIPNAIGTELTWDTVSQDDSTIWDVGTPAGFVIPDNVRKVRLSATIGWDISATGARQVEMRKNAASVVGLPTSSVHGLTGINPYQNLMSTTIDVVAGDLLSIYVYQDSGGNLDVLGTIANTWFALEIVE